MKNATPHTITVYSRSQVREDAARRKLVLLPGATPVVTIPPSGIVLSARAERVDVGHVEDVPATVLNWTAKGIDPVPAEWDGEVVIVSAMYAAAMAAINGPYHGPLAAVDGVVTDETGRPVGCLGLIISGKEAWSTYLRETVGDL